MLYSWPRPAPAPARLRLCSDDVLVERFRGGRDEAFRVIHDRYRARLGAYVRQMLAARASEDVEDVLQDVFERAARMLRASTAPVGLRPWLYSVAHNRCIDELRRRPPAPPDVWAATRPAAGDTTAVAERRADVERLFGDLRMLPELQRSALLMRELQGLSHAELADALGATVPAVKSLLVRARVGLVDAEEARGVPCATIRDDLAATHDRCVKTSARAARHLRECTACRAYRAELRRTSRRVAALLPGPTLFPLAAIGRLLGSVFGHAADTPLAAAGAIGSGGGAIVGAGKLAVLLSVASVAATGAVLERGGSPAQAPAASVRAPSRTVGVPASPTVRAPTAAGGAATVGGHLAPASSSPTGRPTSAALETAAGPPPGGRSQTPSAAAGQPVAPVAVVPGSGPEPAGGVPSAHPTPTMAGSTAADGTAAAAGSGSPVAPAAASGAAAAALPPAGPVSPSAAPLTSAGPLPAAATGAYGVAAAAVAALPAAAAPVGDHLAPAAGKLGGLLPHAASS